MALPRFLLLNLVGAVLWAVAFGFGGWCRGQALEVLLVDVRQYEVMVNVGIVAVAALVWLGHLARRHRRRVAA